MSRNLSVSRHVANCEKRKTCNSRCKSSNTRLINSSWPSDAYIWASKPDHNWFRQCLAACSIQSPYLNECQGSINWILANNCQLNCNQNHFHSRKCFQSCSAKWRFGLGLMHYVGLHQSICKIINISYIIGRSDFSPFLEIHIFCRYCELTACGIAFILGEGKCVSKHVNSYTIAELTTNT